MSIRKNLQRNLAKADPLGFEVLETLAKSADDPIAQAHTGMKPDELPGIQPPGELPAAPSMPEAAAAVDAEVRMAARKRRNRASMILTGPAGAGTPRTAVKTLLGE